MNPVHHIRKNVLAMTQEQLASALGVTQASVSRWEALGTFPTEHQMQIRTLAGGVAGWSDSLFFEAPEAALDATKAATAATPKRALPASQMWGGRFAEGPSRVMEEINASIDFDKRLYAEDIAGSKAHCAMLAQQGIIAKADGDAILGGPRRHTRGDRGRDVYLRPRPRGHPHERRGAACRVDRRRRRAPAHGALAQRPGGHRLAALGARCPGWARR